MPKGVPECPYSTSQLSEMGVDLKKTLYQNVVIQHLNRRLTF